ncbi:MotA/TolQ/ExbB proton channel family protein [Rhodospira trueperi]|uniref:Biopolymer transport protein ExbB n=1 Tax=Rhodospira trueperi TaxID=69960 RepID=A0A1G7AU42_9PROT|nr:MotA/TolQ/ExbB proton channel family protein [Rhodospira trueperi]SDE18077.1 biopolymer transport protein ExbB [Rhodospira trueperi]
MSLSGVIDQLATWLDAGGPVIVILAVLSIYSLTLVILKAVGLAGVLGGAHQRDEAIDAWRRGQREAALRAVADGRRPADRVLSAALRALDVGLDRERLRLDVERLGNVELERLRRHLRTLEVIAAVSPLLGLLGTVLGMIQSFQDLELAGGAANASVLAGGIWQALLTTAAGLTVAIPAAVAANLMAARVDHVGHVIETDVGRLLTVAPTTTPG